MSDAERAGGQRPGGPPPDHCRAAGSLSVAIALVRELRVGFAQLRLQLREGDHG